MSRVSDEVMRRGRCHSHCDEVAWPWGWAAGGHSKVDESVVSSPPGKTPGFGILPSAAGNKQLNRRADKSFIRVPGDAFL